MKTIAIGSLNIDFVVTGINQFPKLGEHAYGQQLQIAPGGKSRNIADMIARLTPDDSVAMMGRTVRDPYGFWKVPVDSLKAVGVNTDYVIISDYNQVKKLPGIAMIPVDKNGNNQIFVVPGISDEFSADDIDAGEKLFEQVGMNDGVLVITLESPLATVQHAIELANQYHIKVLFDPGGIEANTDLNDILTAGIYLIKPNKHETKLLTNIDVSDFDSAQQAAEKFHEKGIENVLITVGAEGGYLFTPTTKKHIPTRKILTGSEKDETGCGDQAMAALCATIQDGELIDAAAELAIVAGTLQFHRIGVRPVEKIELMNARSSYE